MGEQVVAVRLSLMEFLTGIAAGVARMASSSGMKLDPATVHARPWIRRLVDEVCGACGEMALAKWRGIWFVPPLNTFHTVPDLPGGVEVRGTDRFNGALIVRDNDASNRKYVLAVMVATDEAANLNDSVLLAGWCYGHEAKHPRYVRNPGNLRSSWFVPQRDLRPMNTLYE